MGIYADCKLPRSATGKRGGHQDGAWFHPHQCDEFYRMGREPGSTREERKYPRWMISLLKLQSGKWVSGWAGCWVAGAQYVPYPDRRSALQEIILATIRQARVQYRTTGPQRHLVGIEAEELLTVICWARSLVNRPGPKRAQKAQRKTLLEASREGRP